MKSVAARLVPKKFNFALLLWKTFVLKKATNLIEQAPYFPNIYSREFFLYLKIKLSLRRKRFDSTGARKENTLRDPKATPINLRKRYGLLGSAWHSCIQLDGAYLEIKKNI